MNLDKLKESARKYEQSGQWRPAIDVYKKALREFEESGEGVPDPSLYNRIGDLEMRGSDSSAAIRAYEQAADLYTEQGFFNNAIALCSKILRANPGRTSTYLRLAQLNARKNFVSDAKRNLVEYLERMDALHHREDALKAVHSFADQFAGNPDICPMLVDLLRTAARNEEAGEEFERLALELEARGTAAKSPPVRERLESLEADVDGPAASPSPAPRSGPRPMGGDGLVFLDVGAGYVRPADPAGPNDGFDLTNGETGDGWRRDTGVIDGLEFTRESVDDSDGTVSDLLTESPFGPEPINLDDTDPDPLDIDAYPNVELVDLSFESEPDFVPATLDAEGVRDSLVFLPVDDRASPEEAPASEPVTDVAAYARDRARVLFEIGDRSGGIGALEEALRQLEATGRLPEAVRTADDLIQLEPDVIFRYQKRVELAYRAGDREAMVGSYLGLAAALLRGGGVDHALNVYRRVLEHDAENQVARSAISMLETTKADARPSPPPPPQESFIDLGRLIFDEPQSRDTRIRVDQQAPIEDEDAAFHEALEQFKRGIDENIDAEDFQAHYDLGIAFKEMGLLDEAIAQFQKALRAPEGRLKTSEQLGISFFDKGRFAIAEAVLRRAIESLAGGDEDKIGLIYWLGRALESQRRFEEALRFYERALAVDIRLLDVGDRVHRLTTGAQ